MADTLGQDRSTPVSAIRNSSGAIAVLLLAFAPQLFELAWSLAAPVFRFSTRNPAQVLFDHGSALVLAVPGLASGFSNATASPDVLLALIYSYPLLAVAILTLFVRLKAPQDYFGGIVLVAIALFALWASVDLQGMRGILLGAGTAPRMFAALLVALGAGIALVGLIVDGAPLATYAWRGPLFVSLSILSFALTIRPLGLVISGFLTFMVAALGTHETRWKETTIVGVMLTAFCSFLFPYALGLPMQLWPRLLVH
jgi:hypothetical protein